MKVAQSTRSVVAWIVFGLGGLLFAVGLIPFGRRLDLELATWWRVEALIFLGFFISIGALLYLDRIGVTVREYFVQRTRASLVMSAIGSLPIWMMAASQPSPLLFGLSAVSLPLIATKGLTSVRCPRCKGYLGARAALALALWGSVAVSRSPEPRLGSCRSRDRPSGVPRDRARRLQPHA